MKSLLGELRRRHVFRMAVMYAAAGAAILAVAMDVAAAMELPTWIPRMVIFLTILGFPLALVVAWVFELTPEGVKRTDLPPSPPSWDRIQDLLEEVLELPPGERSGFLRRECAGDVALYREVRSLLTAHERAGSLDRLGEEVVSPLVAALHPPQNRMPEPAAAAHQLPSRYEILQEVASGGMGVVYRARDIRLDRVVALKFLSSHLSRDTEAKTRFLIEAQSAAALDHPNICTIHEVGETADGGLFIAMPFYAGETVKERIARGPMEAEDAIGVALQVACGLSRAHDHGILHRDIKPANLVLCPDGVVKIVDFGLAKRPDQELTRSGSALGTVAYMSPEQARGEPVDGRTDLWSLGVVLFEMLTGMRPFRGDSEHAVVREIVEAEPPLPSESRPGIPPVLDAVVRRALSKDPVGRYASAAEFARALEEARAAPAAEAPPGERAEAPALRGIALAPEGERRQAAVVVSHVEGYARLLECLVPEEVTALARRIRAEFSAVAEKHGGTLTRLDEEVSVLLFGVPATREDDFVCAARAALELHERLREVQGPEGGDACRLRLRSGLHAGSVIARPTEHGEGSFRVTGEVLRIAERLAGRAEPDQVLVSPESARLIAGSFRTEPAEPMELRSGARPVVPRRIVGERDFQDPLEGLEREALVAFTGRERELAALRECLGRAVRGEGGLVTVVGEAGAGKSRLLHELRVGLDPVEVRLVHGRCRPSADGGAPYHVFIDALRSSIGLPPGTADSHEPDLVVAKLRAVVPEAETLLPLYLHFLSVHHEDHALPKHLEGEQLRNALQEALVAFFTLLAQRAPTALLIEDWHWADDASQGVLRQLGDMISSDPLLLVVTSRLAEFPNWTQSGQQTSLYLHPLGEGPALSIVASVLEAECVDGNLGRLICERTGGNPFFIEEICRALREEGAVRVEGGQARLEHPVDRLRLPETVQAVIRARLDRVEPAAREVVRVAAVIGREFTRPVLERILVDEPRLGPALEMLKSLGLVQQIRLLPDAAFRFRHALTQEVAYESLLERQRKVLHRRVGEAMEAVCAERIEEHLDALVHHFSRGEDWSRAARYGLGAAERAASLCEFQEALKILERVEEWVIQLPDGEERKATEILALLRRERLCEVLGLRSAQQGTIERLLSILEPGGEPGTLAEVYLRRGDLRVSLRRFEDAREDLLRSLGFARQCGNTTFEHRILRSLGILLWHEGRHDEAVEQMEEVLSLARRERDIEAVVGDLTNLGGVLKDLGWDDRARACLEEALELTGDVELPIKRYYTLYHLALLQRSQGELDSALASLQEAYHLARAWPLPAHFFALTAIAQIHLQQGRIEEALATHRSAVEHSRRAKHADVVAEALRTLGEVLIGLDRHVEALPPLEEAASLFSRLENRESEARVLGRIAAAHEKEGNHAGAAVAWRRTRDLRRDLADAAGELEALEGLARAVRRSGELGEGRECLQQALRLARALGDRKKEGSILNSLGIAEWILGEHTQALVHYEQALGIFQSLDDPVHAGFLLNSIGATLNSLGRPAEAVGRLEQAVSLHLRTGQRLLEGHALAALGEAYTHLNKPELALRAYEDSLAIRRDLADRRGEGWMLYQIASLRAAEGPSPEREEVLARAETIAAEIGDDALAAACSGLSR